MKMMLIIYDSIDAAVYFYLLILRYPFSVLWSITTFYISIYFTFTICLFFIWFYFCHCFLSFNLFIICGFLTCDIIFLCLSLELCMLYLFLSAPISFSLLILSSKFADLKFYFHCYNWFLFFDWLRVSHFMLYDILSLVLIFQSLSFWHQ